MEFEKEACASSELPAFARRTAIMSLAVGFVTLSVARGPASAQAACPLQAGWRWCSKCEGMFYAAASAGMGVCPAGGTHIQTGSGHYLAIFGETTSGKLQGGWRWCSKCQGMFYAAASAGMGVCPAGGTHIQTGSGHYAVLLPAETAAPLQQGGWRWCSKCQGMFYAAASAGMGVCPAGGAHIQTGSGHYGFWSLP